MNIFTEMKLGESENLLSLDPFGRGMISILIYLPPDILHC